MGIHYSRTDEGGNRRWYRNCQLHRDGDLPAVEFNDGAKGWYQYGKLYRGGGLPAYVDSDGDEFWYDVNILPHRDGDLPAVDDNHGYRRWYRHGKAHRGGDLPATEYQNGDKTWYYNGQVHRDGNKPAIEYIDGRREYCKRGTRYTLEQLGVYYSRLMHFGKRCLGEFRMHRLRQVRWIHGELLCMPPKGNFPGGQDYHKMVNYFNKL